MLIYNRMHRFGFVGEPLVKVGGRVQTNYKIKRRSPNAIIKNSTVPRSRSRSIIHKLKPLTQKNIEFLTDLGFKVLKKK